MKVCPVLLCASLCIAAGCSSPFVKQHPGQQPAETSTVRATEQSSPMKKSQETLLDTLNKGHEAGLADSDFTPASASSIVPAYTTGHSAASTVSPVQSTTEVSFRFRIQVFASSQIENLRQEKKDLETKVNLPFFISFESPYYKLYAGNFNKREDAEVYLPQFKKMGYNDSWVVRTKPLKDE